MKRILVLLSAVAAFSLGATATFQCFAPTPSTITVEVVNDTPVAAQATFDSSSDPNISQDDLLQTGNVSSLTVGSGLSDSFDLTCDEAQALILDRADLLVTGGGAVGSTILYLDQDYFCGEVLTFTLTASDDLATLNVAVTYSNQ